MIAWVVAACSEDPASTPHSTGSTGIETVDPTGPTGTSGSTGTDDAVRRYDCSGMDPRTPAPLGGNVFLTFDDGPNPDTTPQVLDVLRAHGIPATFMMLGQNAADPADADLIREIVADPHFHVGNHTWDHTDLVDLSLPDAATEIDDTTAVLETFGVEPAFFRFPYGDGTCAAHDLATERGFRVAGWHIDPADWCYAAGDGICTTADYWRVPPEYADDMIGLSMEQIRRFDGGVVLFHDIHAWTADHLDEFVQAVLAEGYRFGALDDAALLPNLNAGTPADLPFMGERCSLADDRCWEVEHAAWCEAANPADPDSDDGICTLACEGYCLDRDGAPTTFCADLGRSSPSAPASSGAGQCVAHADPIDHDCADLPGTVAAELPRFVGTSGAPGAVASVCAPADWR